MRSEEIQIGKRYRRLPSGTVRKVLGMPQSDDGRTMVNYETVRKGHGRGKHLDVGERRIVTLEAFMAWADEVEG